MAIWAGDNASGEVIVGTAPRWPSGTGRVLTLRVKDGGSLIFTDPAEVTRVAAEMVALASTMEED